MSYFNHPDTVHNVKWLRAEMDLLRHELISMAISPLR